MRHATEYQYQYCSNKTHSLEKAEVYQNSTIFRDTHTTSPKVVIVQFNRAQKNWQKTLMIREQWDTLPHSVYRCPTLKWLAPLLKVEKVWIYKLAMDILTGFSHLSRFLQSNPGIVHWIRAWPVHSTHFPIGCCLSCCHSMLFNVNIYNCNQVN